MPTTVHLVGRAEAQVARPFSRAVWTIAHLLPNATRKTGKRHIYLRLDRYVQSVLQRQMRREAGLPGTEKG